jgi:hypothetical protein
LPGDERQPCDFGGGHGGEVGDELVGVRTGKISQGAGNLVGIDPLGHHRADHVGVTQDVAAASIVEVAKYRNDSHERHVGRLWSLSLEVMRPLDTTEAARQRQLAVYRAMTGSQRVELMLAISAEFRDVQRAGIRSRHPDYDDHMVECAFRRHTLGDELFRRAFPHEPVLAA